jgi:hypothetical protein
MRRPYLAVVLTAVLMMLSTSSALGAQQSPTLFQGGQKAGSAFNMEVVGQDDLGGRGFNADVWAHEGFAYIGHWGFSDWAKGSKTRFCPEPPDSGVAVVDYRDPASPEMASRLVNPDGTSAEDVVTFTAEFGPLAGRDIAAVGIQVCGGDRQDESFARGLQLWDVTDPAAPVELALLDTGCCTRGVHELEVEHRPDIGRTFAYVSVPASEYEEEGSPSGFRDREGRGDFRLIDITDPANPVEVSDWGVIHDAGGPLGPGQGCDPDPVFGHSAEPSADGKTAFVAYWDSGFVALDVTDPADPVLLGDTDYDADEDGDGHSSMYDDARELLFTADEDFGKNCGPDIERGYGYLRVYDASDLSSMTQIGEYRTPGSMGTGLPASGDYTIHNPMVHDETVYISWYSDGIRVVDSSDPTNPTEIAHFVPPAGLNPVKPSQRGVLSNTPQMWGVYYDEERDLVLGSDMNSGLWILQVTD